MNEQMLAYQRIEKLNKIERYHQLNHFVQKGQFLFSGSSLAEQFPIEELLVSKDLVSFDFGKMIYNRGVGGFVIDELLENLDTLIFELAPSKLFINIGSNDIGLPEYNQTTLIDKYQTILDQINQNLPECDIYILSYYPVNPNKASFIPEKERTFIFASRSNEAIIRANQELIELADKNKATYIDVTSCLLDSSGLLDEELTIEGIHLWPKAYMRVLQILIPYFKS